MEGHSVNFNVAIEAVGDQELKAVLQVDCYSTPEDFNDLIQSKSDVIARYGYSRDLYI